jgi:hypothetical protein
MSSRRHQPDLKNPGGSASLANAFDLFIDLGILRILRLYRVVALHSGSWSYSAIDATPHRSTSRVARRANRCRTDRRTSGG